MYTFGFHVSAIFSLEYIKVCLRHDLSTHMESQVTQAHCVCHSSK